MRRGSTRAGSSRMPTTTAFACRAAIRSRAGWSRTGSTTGSSAAQAEAEETPQAEARSAPGQTLAAALGGAEVQRQIAHPRPEIGLRLRRRFVELLLHMAHALARL